MSDASQGPGWWQASDGKWYPPEQAQGAQPTPAGGGGATGAVDIGTVLSYAWNKFLANIGDILIIWLIVIAVQVVFNVASNMVDSLVVSFGISIIGFVASMIVQIGLIRVGLLVTAGQQVTPAAAFDTALLGPFIIGSLLYGLAVLIGFFALCVGALVAAFLLWFYGYYILDAQQQPVDALKSSYRLTSQNFGTVGLWALVAVALGCITCGLAGPIVQIGSAYVYRTLNGQSVAA